jgi:alpha-methylacyl-CoA racemase
MGPLHGVKIVEIASLGPGPFAVMLLADMGADVIRLERTSGGPGAGLGSGAWNVTNRGRPSVAVDLKQPDAVELVLRLVRDADALIEGFRPGVMEKLGLGPAECLAANPRLVYGRMTGYGQDGPMSRVAGHDINYISIAGALGAIKRDGERPLFPLNLLGDYGGGGMFLAFGVVCGILEARASGQGQVVDTAMVEGTAVLTAIFHGMRQAGLWSGAPGNNLLDTGAHWYEVYETADGGYVSVGSLEPQFYAELLRLLELDAAAFPQFDQARWPEFKERFADVFRAKTRDEWAQVLEPAEACATVVRDLEDAASHPHNVARGVFVEVDGITQPAPAPRFSRTQAEIRHGARDPGADTDTALAAWGVGAEEIDSLRAAGAIS